MESRWYHATVVVFWLASLGWLVTTKILPAVRGGQPPVYADLLVGAEAEEETVCWTIFWQERQVGWARNMVTHHRGGTAEVQSTTQFDRLPVTQMVREMFGPLAVLLKPALGRGPDTELDLRIVTRTSFDEFQQLARLDTRVDVGTWSDFLNLQGVVVGTRLKVLVRAGPDLEGLGVPPGGELYRSEVDLPPDALVADSLSPQPRWANLRLGQSWTFQAYRPFPPTDPLQRVEARVEEEDILSYHGHLVPTCVVVYRAAAGSGITAAREPFSRMWVQEDGTVIKQELLLSGLRIQFLRAMAAECGEEPSAAQPSPARFPTADGDRSTERDVTVHSPVEDFA